MAYTGIVNPLDLWTIFVNFFSGSLLIFFFITLALIVFLASRFRMTNMVVMMMICLFILLMKSFGMVWLYVIVILLTGMLFYLALGKLFNR